MNDIKIKNEEDDSVRINIELKFIEEHVREPVTIFLINGVKLECEILNYDDIVIVTSVKNSKRSEQLVYKHAIASIVEVKNV
jgi:RNA chaperone Hfq